MNDRATPDSALAHAPALLDVVASEQGLLELASEWDALAARSDTALPFNAHAWATACWSHFHRHAHGCTEALLHVVVLREHGRAIAIAPLWIAVRRLPGFTLRIAQWIGEGPSDYGDLLVETGRTNVTEMIAAHLFAPDGPCHLVDLRECPSDSTAIVALRSALARHASRIEASPDSTCHAIDATGGWEGYLRNQFRHKRRTDLRREQRHLAEDGAFAYAITDRLEPFTSMGDAFGAVQGAHVAAGVARPGEFNDPVFRSFLDTVLERSASLGWLKVATLSHHDRVVAYLLGFSWRGRCYLYNTAHEAGSQSHGAGKLLMLHLFKHLMDEGHVLIDFLRGAESYKASLTNLERHNLRLRAARAGLSGRLAWHLHERLLPALQARSPRAADLLRHAGEEGLPATGARLVRRLLRGRPR
ncbi:MAG: GNAT family N-acetyltransferase [Pseudomonadota bacterium]